MHVMRSPMLAAALSLVPVIAAAQNQPPTKQRPMAAHAPSNATPGVPAGDPLTLAFVAALLITASIAAALIPCWRAARVHPAHSLSE